MHPPRTQSILQHLKKTQQHVPPPAKIATPAFGSDVAARALRGWLRAAVLQVPTFSDTEACRAAAPATLHSNITAATAAAARPSCLAPHFRPSFLFTACGGGCRTCLRVLPTDRRHACLRQQHCENDAAMLLPALGRAKIFQAASQTCEGAGRGRRQRLRAKGGNNGWQLQGHKPTNLLQQHALA